MDTPEIAVVIPAINADRLSRSLHAMDLEDNIEKRPACTWRVALNRATKIVFLDADDRLLGELFWIRRRQE